MTTPSSIQSPPQQNPKRAQSNNALSFSVDTWAVALSLALSLLVWLGLIKHIPW